MKALPQTSTPEALRARVGREADHVVEWSRLGDVPAAGMAHLRTRVLYAVEDREHLWYLGKSDDLPLRLGYLLAGVTFGDERFHPGGARMRELGVDPGSLRVSAFLGDDLYRRHYQLVRELKPVCNRETWLYQGPRRVERPEAASPPVRSPSPTQELLHAILADRHRRAM